MVQCTQYLECVGNTLWVSLLLMRLLNRSIDTIMVRTNHDRLFPQLPSRSDQIRWCDWQIHRFGSWWDSEYQLLHGFHLQEHVCIALGTLPDSILVKHEKLREKWRRSEGKSLFVVISCNFSISDTVLLHSKDMLCLVDRSFISNNGISTIRYDSPWH